MYFFDKEMLWYVNAFLKSLETICIKKSYETKPEGEWKRCEQSDRRLNSLNRNLSQPFNLWVYDDFELTASAVGHPDVGHPVINLQFVWNFY